MPIAYAFGYVCRLVFPGLFLPCSLVGYWISNVVGILLMQFGAVDMFVDKPKERNLKKDLLVGLATSIAYTLIIIDLIHFNILETPSLFFGN